MANKDNKQQIVINQIITRPVNRQVVDIGKWRIALRSADMGRVQQLYDLYEDILLDGVLADAIDKRIRAVTGADVTFQDDNGEESVEMIAFIDTQEFETLLIEIMQSLFWGRSLIELTFDADKGMNVYSIPKKHIRPDTKKISIQENDPDGSIDYAELPNMIEVVNRKDKFGVILRACPYAIFKRGGFSDWAQMVEIFGMPRRVGKYSIYDVEARKQLQEAFDSQGAAATLIVPKETDVETEAGGATVSGSLYKDFISTCDEQLLITVLSQTMTTMDGSSRSQSETHKEVEEALNKHDLRFVQRILNQKVKPILEARGFPVKGGSFVFPKALEQLTIDQLTSLSDILDIPAYYIQERFGIPQASDGDILAKRKSPEPNEPDKGKKKEEKLTDTERGWFMNLFDFFAYAPTTWSGADRKKKPQTNRSFTAKLTDSITAKLTLADNYSIDIKSLLNQALNEVYNNGKSGKEQPVVSKPLFDISNEALQQAVDSAFAPDFGKKNQDFIDEFKHNTAVFAAFKNHHQTKDMVALLTDENGNLRSFREFKKLALNVSKKYNENWLRTEYNTAVRSARAAVNFRKYLESEELYPNLEYVQSTASHPRVSHLGYVGTILPIRHEWWDTHMPPSDWNCACSVRPTDKEPTAVPEGEYVSPVFQNNPGKSAEFVKLKEHPYIKGVGKTLVDEIKRFVEDDEYIELKKFKNRGRILLHRLVNTSEGDYKDKYTIARKFAENGAIVKITPVVHYKSSIYERIYKSLINTPYYKKCPDLMVGDLFYEYERYLPPFKARKISNMISNGSKQSPYLIINNNKGATHRYIRRNVFERLNDKTFKFDIKELWVYEKGKLNLVYKKQ